MTNRAPRNTDGRQTTCDGLTGKGRGVLVTGRGVVDVAAEVGS